MHCNIVDQSPLCCANQVAARKTAQHLELQNLIAGCGINAAKPDVPRQINEIGHFFDELHQSAQVSDCYHSCI
jgi:hypothetical protein